MWALGLAVIMWLAGIVVPALASEDAAWAALRSGAIVLFRHARAPGTGDPPHFRLNDCATQRNLSEAGREQARRIGGGFQARSIDVGRVVTSQWCRARETAELAFPGKVRDEPSLNSFFDDRSRAASQTEAALQLMATWRGPGAMVAVTHQVNVTALTGIFPREGEGIVVRFSNAKLDVIGRIMP
jgi:phosphohistidine phosphatase SixA